MQIVFDHDQDGNVRDQFRYRFLPADAEVSAATGKPIDHVTAATLANTDFAWDWRVGDNLTADHRAAADELVALYTQHNRRPVTEWQA